MKYEFTIFGSGISAKIISSLLARSGFRVCLIKDKDKNKVDTNTNLVTFLSSGSLNYLSSAIAKMELFNEYPEIEKIKCQLIDSVDNQKQMFTTWINYLFLYYHFLQLIRLLRVV